MKQLILATALTLLAVPAFAGVEVQKPSAQEVKDTKQTQVLLHHEDKIRALQAEVKVLQNEVETLWSAVGAIGAKTDTLNVIPKAGK